MTSMGEAPASTARATTNWARYVPLLAILLLGLCLRSLYFTTPLADAHRWRQVDNAAIARHFAEGPFDIFHPQVNWGGGGVASVEMEFPLLPAIIAVFYKIFGESHLFGRAVVMAFSLATIVALYALGRRVFGEAAGRAAAFLFAISPTAVYFGRAIIVDTPTVFFSVAAILAFLVYTETDQRKYAIMGGLCLALAWMVKLPAFLTFGPVAFIGWRARGFGILRDRWFLAAVAFAFVATALWYWHANNLYLRTGLTVGIWRGAGTYPGILGELAGPTTTFTGWSTRELLMSSEWWRTLFTRFWHMHLTPAGFVLTAIGCVLALRVPRASVIYVWLAATVAFVFAVGTGNLGHEYYQLPVIAPAALFFGVAAAPVFDGRFVSRLAGKIIGPVAIGAALTVMALISFHESFVVPNFFRPETLDLVPVQAGRAIDQALPEDALLIVVELTESDNAANAPMLLYHTRRKGWSFDLRGLTPAAIQELRNRGAGYFATTIWPDLQRAHPGLAQYMVENLEEVPLTDAPRDTRVFRLVEK
jgi:4-amino-4-deoxy-L-arabinose transferase-like glycosyltransferase